MSNRPKINRNLFHIFALADIGLTIKSLSIFDLAISCHDIDNEDDHEVAPFDDFWRDVNCYDLGCDDDGADKFHVLSL